MKEQLSTSSSSLDKLNQRILEYKTESSSSLMTCNQLRQDRDDITEKYNILLQKGNDDSNKLASLNDLNKDYNDLKRDKENMENDLKKVMKDKEADMIRMKRESDEEILHLKDCVRRECEERTHMLIELSELRDQLAMMGNSNLPPPKKVSTHMVHYYYLCYYYYHYHNRILLKEKTLMVVQTVRHFLKP